MDLHRMPKVELHRHLEGSVRLPTAFALAEAAHLALPASSPEALRRALCVLEPMDDLAAVLAVFDLIGRLFVSTDVVERLAYEVVCDAAAENIRLLELRYSPDYMSRRAGLDWDHMTEAILRGVARATAEHDIVVGLIAIVSRSLGLVSARRTVDYALRWGDALVGFDLADDEVSWPSGLFREELARLEGAGLGLTVHSGEASGPAHVWETLRALSPRRLGHGVAVGADPALVQEVLRRGVAIEVCPTSNLRTRAVPSLREHPARALFQAGVPLCFNTDDPGLFDVTLTEELRLAHEEMGFTLDELQRIQRGAIFLSFLTDAQKATICRSMGDETPPPPERRDGETAR